MITHDPFASKQDGKIWHQRGVWPCKWIACSTVSLKTAKIAARDGDVPLAPPPPTDTPMVTVYRLKFRVGAAATARVHVSADERYELFLDGTRIGRGSERGDGEHWFFETYDLALSRGRHTLVARVWALGSLAPFAQFTVYPGFILAPEEPFTELLGTGHARWETKEVHGYEFLDAGIAWGTGAKVAIHGDKVSWDAQQGGGRGWKPAFVRDEGVDAIVRNNVPRMHRMLPAMLPPMLEVDRHVGTARFATDSLRAAGEPLPMWSGSPPPGTLDTRWIPVLEEDDRAAERASWNALLAGKGTVTIPANSVRRVIVDLGDYYCAYPQATFSGGKGSSMRLLWAEGLIAGIVDGRHKRMAVKGNRNDIWGRCFVGVGDVFFADGGEHRVFDTLWWEAGRYVEVLVETRDEPLTIEDLHIRETRYPLEQETAFATSDARLERVMPIMVRALQMCSHETYMDCPYYEQLMYVGDTRMEVLATYCLTNDDRLPRKAIRCFDDSRLQAANGLTSSRYPSRVRQIIPPFSLWWIGMVHDFVQWRGDLAWAKQFMPGGRSIVDSFLSYRNDEGLVAAPPGWNYMDWAWTWDQSHGMPKDADKGVSGMINWQFVLALKYAAELESIVGEPEMAARAMAKASQLAARLNERFWDEARGLYADDLGHEHFSEHTQCLALLSGAIGHGSPAGRQARVEAGLLADPALVRTTIYFSFYLFEALRQMGRVDRMIDRMGTWFDHEKLGMKTTLESPEPSRSDCHAWGAHPIYHYFASILGIRPSSIGMATVRIAPMLGPLTHAKGRLTHPGGGFIEVEVAQSGPGLRGSIVLPPGVTGTIVAGGRERALQSGHNTI